MRSLILRRDNDDRGAVLVWVALMLVVLFGFGAFVIDVGALYVERRELQNGADAAALAVAADCAEGDCKDEAGTANTYADSNAKDNAATVDEVCGSGPGLPTCATPPPGTAGKSDWVQVKTSTDNPANSNPTQVKFVLAPVLDALNKGSTVKASAVAAWGPVGGATTIPFTFSVCEFKALGGSVVPPLTFPNTPGYIYEHGTGPAGYHDCLGNPSGQNLPGGFGWLDSTSCEAAVTVGGWVGSDTGNPMPTGCNPTTWQNAEVLIPIYNETRGTGSNAEYRIVGFAGFKVLAYDFGNNKDSWSADGKNFDCPPNGNDERCFYGQFTRVTTTGDIGGGTDFGARTISMIG